MGVRFTTLSESLNLLSVQRLIYSHPVFGSGSVMTNAPELYEFSLVGNWDQLLSRCSSHPQEAMWTDKCNNAALHLACRRQPPKDVILALIRTNPTAVKQCTIDGLTPLHFACYCGASAEVVSILITTFDAAPSMVDKRGRTPLHCACMGFRTRERVKAIKILLESAAQTVMWQDEKGRTPLSLMFDDYAEEIQEGEVIFLPSRSSSGDVEMKEEEEGEEDKEEEQQPPPQAPPPPERALAGSELQECWKITSLLLRAAYHGSISDPPPDTDQFRIVHAAVGVVECPTQFVQLIFKLYPESVKEKDSDGNLPIHIAAKARAKTIISSDNHSPLGEKKRPLDRPGWTRGSVLNETPHESVLHYLLELYPDAAFVNDKNGKLPYLLAIESGKSWKDEGLNIILDHSKEVYDDVLVQKSILRALQDHDSKIRKNMAKYCGKIVQYWQADLDPLVTELLKESGSCCEEEEEEGQQRRVAERYGILAAIMMALAEVIKGGKDKIKDEEEKIAEEAMNVGKKLMGNDDENVREGAAMVIGAVGEWKGIDAVMGIVNQLVEEVEEENELISLKHGKAWTCYHILSSTVGEELSESAFDQITQLVKNLMRDENELVIRKAACVAIGGVLGRSKDTSATLKDMKSTILKRMKATEDMEVHISLARGLRAAVRMKDDTFKGKSGLPIMDAALMLAMSGSPSVQQAFIKFLWLAMKVGDGKDGLYEYMDQAEGENGRIMMTLVTKILEKIDDVDDE